MKKFFRNIFFVFSLMFFLINNVFALEVHHVPGISNINVDVDTKVYHNDIQGNSSQSLLTPGTSYEENLSFYSKESYGDDYSFEWMANLRSTDDPIVDRRNWHLLKAYAKIAKKDIYSIEFGDIYSAFSQYSLSSALEGVQGIYNYDYSSDDSKTHFIKATIVAARANRAVAANNYERQVFGTRLENSFNKYLSYGFNVVRNYDNPGTISEDQSISSNLSPDDNWVYSFDFNLKDITFWQVERLAWDTELAQSWFDDNIKEDAYDSKKDWAFRSGWRATVFKKLDFNFGYERVNPNFHTNTGSAAVDQELFRSGLTYRFAQWLRIKMGFVDMHNNLKKLLTTTQKSKIPTASVFFNPIPKWKDLSVDLSYRGNYLDSSDKSIESIRNTYTGTVSYTYKKAYVNLTQEYQKSQNKANRDNDARAVMTSTTIGLRSIQLSDSYKLSPSFTTSFEHEKYSDAASMDKYINFRTDFRLDYKDYLYFRGSYGINDSNRSVLLADSIRVVCLFEIVYTPKFKYISPECSLKYEDRNNNYEDKTREYQERIIEFCLKFKF